MFKAKVVRTKIGKGAKGLLATLLGPSRVEVGFPSGATDSEVIERAVYNEFGTKNIPERPALRNAIRSGRSSNAKLMKAEARNIIVAAVQGKDPVQAKRKALTRLGIKVQGEIQAEITSLRSPPNAPSTIKQKGSSNPLIDTGEMRASVSYRIKERDR